MSFLDVDVLKEKGATMVTIARMVAMSTAAIITSTPTFTTMTKIAVTEMATMITRTAMAAETTTVSWIEEEEAKMGPQPV